MDGSVAPAPVSTRMNKSLRKWKHPSDQHSHCFLTCSSQSQWDRKGKRLPRIAADLQQPRNQAQRLKKQVPATHPQLIHGPQSLLLKPGTLLGLLPTRLPIPLPVQPEHGCHSWAGEDTHLSPPPSPQSSLFALRLLCRTRSSAQPEEQSYGERVQRPLTRQLRATSSLGQRWCDHGRRKFSNRNNQASWKCWSLRGARLFAIPWTMDLQAPLFMEFSRQEHWSE